MVCTPRRAKRDNVARLTPLRAVMGESREACAAVCTVRLAATGLAPFLAPAAAGGGEEATVFGLTLGAG